MKKNSFFYEKLMKSRLSILFLFFSYFISNAQVTTNSGSGLAATYPDLATAITALNGATITSPVVITLTGNETAPAGGYTLIAQGDATNTIIIEGVTSTITANAALTAGSFNDAIFKLIGADYVTIRNFTMQENVANTTTTAATNNMTEWGIALLYDTTTNGAQNNTIQNNTITLNRTYQNTFGIYSNSTHTATAPTTAATATGTTGGNSGLRIYTNNISNVNNGIVVVGPTAAADQNTGIDIGGSSLATANTITDYGTTGTFTAFANVSGTVNGILVRNSYGFNISYNTVSSSVGGVTVGTLNGIQIPTPSNLPTATFTNTISNNTISLKSGNATGTMNGILTPGAASVTSILNIINNDFNNFGHTTATATGTITFISNSSVPAALNVSNNTFTNLSLNTTGTTNFVLMTYSTTTGTGTKNVTNNSIVTGFTKTAANGNVVCVTDNGSSSTGTLTTVQNNNFSNITVLGTSTILGINLTDGGTAPTKNITGNVFNNWSGATGAITPINITYWNGVSTLSNNTITNITGQGAITGINMGNTVATATSITVSLNTITGLSSTGAGGAVTGLVCANTSSGISIFDNVINTLSSTGASAVNGITISGANAAGTNVYKHKIYNLSGSNVGSTVNGINITGGTLVTIYNNIIGDLTAPIANAANPINGINITGGTTVNAYYNSVMLNATSSGALFGSSAINASTTPTVTLINNIFVNNSTVTGAGLATAYRRSTATLTSYGSTSNNNLFFGTTIFTDGTNTDATLAAYKVRVATRDAASATENPTFLSTTGSNANFLHIDSSIATFCESGASSIGSITNDFDGNIRQGAGGYVGTGVAPDMGADEFEGIPSTPACSGTPAATNALSSVTSVCSGISFTLSLSTAYTELNYTYQWQSSPDGVAPYTNISAANGATLATTQTASTFYQCIITCTNGGATTTSTPVQVTMNSVFTCYCASTYTSGAGTTDGITNVTLLTLNNTSTQNNVAPYSTFYNAVTVPDLPQNSNQSISITFGSDGSQFAGVWIDWNQDGDFSDGGEFVANNAVTAGGAGVPLVMTIAVPVGATLGQTMMRVRGGNDSVLTNTPCGASSSGFGETEDYIVNVVANPICTGAPVASNTTAPTSVCSGTNFNLGLSVVQTGTGYTYQWQSSPDGIAPYVDISGQTATTATLSQTAATYYQCVITCTGSGLTTISTSVQVNLNLLVDCFCPAAVSSTADTEIGNVTFGSLNNGVATPVLNNATAVNTYTSFTSLPATNIVQGEPTAFSLSQITSGGTFYPAFANVFIDYNGNGVFDLPAERALSVGSTVATPLNNLLTGNITIPVTSITGNVLMRVVLLEGGSNATPACNPLGTGTTYGEVEDYVLNITACEVPVITAQPTTTISVCENGAVNLSVTATGTALTYQWKKDTVDIALATSSSYSIPTALVADSGSYTVLVTGACGTVLSDASVVTVTANSSLATEVVTACDSYTWAANGTTYTVGGIYTNTVNCVTRTLDLTITPSSSLPNEVVTACDSYTWAANGTTYTVGGIYTNVVNCVTRTLDLTINASTTTTTNVTVCDTYTWAENGATYTVGGTYTNVTTNGAGCPNTATLNLVVTNASIDFANLQFPSSAAICEGGTMTAYGQVYESGLTEAAGQATGIDVEFGYNLTNTNPNTWSTWAPATFNVQVGNNDEYMATTSNALVGGTYYYTFRYRLSGCSTWQYGGDNNGFWNGTTQNSGVLTINSAVTPTGAATQTLNGGVAADVTIEDIVVSGTGIVWYPTALDAANNTNAIAAGTVLTDNTYYYAVSVNGTCRSASFEVLVTVVLGTSSFDLSQLTYYPNPVKDIFNVKYNKEIISADVYDLTGRKVIEIKPNTLEVQLNMTNLSNAMYIVRLQSVDGITELKVYKN